MNNEQSPKNRFAEDSGFTREMSIIHDPDFFGPESEYLFSMFSNFELSYSTTRLQQTKKTACECRDNNWIIVKSHASNTKIHNNNHKYFSIYTLKIIQ